MPDSFQVWQPVNRVSHASSCNSTYLITAQRCELEQLDHVGLVVLQRELLAIVEADAVQYNAQPLAAALTLLLHYLAQFPHGVLLAHKIV
jgi:hypothetical protein